MSDIEVKRITSVLEYLNGIDEIHKLSNLDKFAYRGIGINWEFENIEDNFENKPKCLWNAKTAKYGDDKKLVSMQEDLINELTMSGHNKEDKKDLELLAEVQHIEPRTCFIDYSLNPLVALYFACLDEEKNGLVVVNNIGLSNFRKVGTGHIKNEIKTFFEDEASSQKDNDSSQKEPSSSGGVGPPSQLLNESSSPLPWFWKLPTANNPRIIAQQAVVIFGKNITKGEAFFYIEKNDKSKIKKDLEKLFGIDGNMLFPDFHGRAKWIVTNKDFDYYFKQADTLFQQGEYEKAIEDYTKAIELNSNFAEAYNNRGLAKGYLNKYDEAIEDFNEAIKLNPKCRGLF